MFFRAYREIFALIRELSIYDKILWKDHALKYTMAGGQSLEFRAWPLPGPLPAVFTNTSISLAGKLALARAPPSTALASFIAWLRPAGRVVPSPDAAASTRAPGLQFAESGRILETRRAWLARGHGAASWRETGGGEHARWAGVAAKLCGPV